MTSRFVVCVGYTMSQSATAYNPPTPQNQQPPSPLQYLRSTAAGATVPPPPPYRPPTPATYQRLPVANQGKGQQYSQSASASIERPPTPSSRRSAPSPAAAACKPPTPSQHYKPPTPSSSSSSRRTPTPQPVMTSQVVTSHQAVTQQQIRQSQPKNASQWREPAVDGATHFLTHQPKTRAHCARL